MDTVILDHYRRYLDGDESALGEIVRAYSDSMIFFTKSIVKNFSDAEEIVSDAFVHIAVRKHAFRGDSQLKTYLFAICRHKAVDLLRKKVSRGGDAISVESELDADTVTLESRILRSERDEALHRAMSELCEEYRTALYLAYFENMPHEDVARAMKKSRKQTENIIFRARRALRAMLEKEGFTSEDI